MQSHGKKDNLLAKGYCRTEHVNAWQTVPHCGLIECKTSPVASALRARSPFHVLKEILIYEVYKLRS